jgi:probable HAF family extracellular repeat protein
LFILIALLTLSTNTSAQTTPPLPQGNYTITDLGVLNSLQDTDSAAVAINNNGTVVGYSGVFVCVTDTPDQICTREDAFQLGYQNTDAFVWTPTTANGTMGTMSHPNTLPGDYCSTPLTPDPYTGGTDGGFSGSLGSDIYDVNIAGKAAGYSFTTPMVSNCDVGQYNSVIYFNGSAQDLGAAPGYTETGNILSNPMSSAYSINDAGVVVGYTAGHGNPASNGWVYDGSYHLLGNVTVGIYNSTIDSPNKINNNGIVVGCTDLGGYVHSGTGPLQSSDLIGPLSGGTASCPLWINDAGGVVGQSDLTTTSGYYTDHAFYLDPNGNMKDLGTLSGDPLSESAALGINNSAHDVVGYSDVDLSKNPAWVWSQHATLWQSGGLPTDLNLLLDPSQVVSTKCPNCWELISANNINDHGQIVGEGIYYGNHHAFLLTPKCINDGGDTDGDGLCDNWEKYGYTDPKTGAFVNLPAMGADPMHKDIFVQADYMVNSTVSICDSDFICDYAHSHKPNPDAMNMVINAFANAPVENPDGLTGIAIHIDCGSDCIMNPLTGQTWGNLSAAQAIDPEVTPFGSDVCDENGNNCDYDWAALNAEMSLNFIPLGRLASFHYMIYVHEIGDSISVPPGAHVTGIADTPGSNFLVGLGGQQRQIGTLALDVGPNGTVLQQAGNFMHELGHNLGLMHGGIDGVNFKPNYLSIMNYNFVELGLFENGSGGYIDYSRFPAIPALNEYALLEPIGLNGGPAIAGYGTRYSCYDYLNTGSDVVSKYFQPYVLNANGPIDWNCNGMIDPQVLTGGLDIDNDQLITPTFITEGGVTIPGPDVVTTFIPTAPLISSEDWSHLVYAGGAIGGLSLAPKPPTSVPHSSEPPIPYFSAPYQVEVVSPGLAIVSPGISLNLTYTITNSGDNPDSYNLVPVSQYNWWNTSGVPASVSLASGASQQIIIPLTVPLNLGCGNLSALHATFLLRAVSQAHPNLMESDVAEVEVMSAPGTVAVPSVSGLPQSAAQTAILAGGFALGSVTMQSSSSVPASTVISQSPVGCGFAASGAPISLVVSSGPPEATVPNVVGMTQAAAIAAMSAAGLSLGGEPITVASSSVAVGDVVSQNPPAGTQVTPGTFFSLTIASATPAYDLTPNITGYPISTAMSSISSAGLNLGLITQAVSTAVPNGTVLSQVPAAGSPTSPGSYVNVTVSYNYTLEDVPNLVGDTQTNAISAILAAGYSIGSISEAASNVEPAGIVFLQSPLGGGIVLSPTTPISFSISTGPVGPQSFIVPNVYGLPQAVASSAITTAGLTVGTVTPSPELSIPAGNVFSQTPAPGAYAAGGSAVNLQVSAAPAQYIVPNLLTPQTYYSTASANIVAAGLTPGTFTAEISSAVTYGYVISQTPAADTVVAAGSPVNVTYSLGNGYPGNLITVPNVVGENQAFAIISIEPPILGLYVSVTRVPSTTIPDSFVISQDPPAGAQVPISQTVNLVVSSGGPVTAAVPNVVGSLLSESSMTGAFPVGTAEPTLNAAGFAVGSVTYQPSNSVPFGQVISQNPPAGTMAAWDTSVNLVFSSGPATSVTVPNIVGESQGLAISALGEASLRWTLTTQSSQTVPAGTVTSQNPPAGTVLLGALPGAFIQEGNVPVSFVVSAGPNAVPTYSLLTQFGDYGGTYAGDGQFAGPASLAIDPNTGNILAGDQTGRIQIFDRNGNFKGFFGGNGVEFLSTTVPGSAQLATIYPTGAGGGLFADGYLPSIGETISQSHPLGLAVDPINGNVVALDLADRVLIYNSAGVFQSTFGSPGAGPGQFAFNALGGVAIDPVTENILVSDWGNNRVQIFSSTGVYLNQFGTQGSGNGQFGYGPVGIAVDPETRNIVVLDRGTLEGAARVQIFNSSGAYLSQFGAPAKAGNATWSTDYCVCEGVAIDPVSHNIIVQGAVNSVPTPAPSIQIFDSKGNYLSQFSGFGISTVGGLALDPASHHIVTFGLSTEFDGAVLIYGAPVPLTPTSTAVTSSLNPAASGQSVTFTATVSGASPTGTVQFYYGASTLGTPVALAAGVASFTTSSLPIGTDSIAAVYSGDGSNSGSTSDVLNELVSSSSPTTTLMSSLNPAIAGQAVTFTATVTGASPTGTVAFLSGTTSLGAPVALASGMAAFTTSSLPVGTDSITAVYSGDSSNAASTSAVLSQTVSLYPTTTGVLASANHATVGQPITLTAIVKGDSPTGTVRFLDGASTLGAPVAMTGNEASLTITTLTAGTHSITAVYSGDSFNATSTSPAINEVLSLNGATTTSLSASSDPITIGSPVTFTANVTGSSPTGTIQFVDGATNLGSPVVLSGSVAAVTTSTLSAGTHAITAVYSGDNANAASTSAIVSEVVSLTATTTTITASVNPAVVGQQVTFTASVTGNNPSGPILFLDGTTPLVAPTPLVNGRPSGTNVSASFNSHSDNLTNGQASVTLTTLAAGTHAITAVYNGDSSNSPSASTVLSEIVTGKAAQTITFGGLPNVTYGVAPITLSASASSSLPVSFALTSGPATLSGSTLTITGTGTVTITASQAGNATYPAAAPVVQSFTVSPALLKVTANNAAMAAGSAVPSFGFIITGFVNGDSQASATTGSPLETTTASSTSPAGTYPITITQGTLAAANYTFTFMNGTLTVTGAPTLVSIGVSPSTGSLPVGAAQNYTASGTYSDASVKNLTSQVTWSSTNTAAATISSSGYAFVVGTGSTTITASLSGVNGTASLSTFAPSYNVVCVPTSITTDANGNYVVQVSVSNDGTVTLSSVTITAAKLISTAATSLPPSITNLGPGATVSVTLTFPSSAGVAGARGLLQVQGSYVGAIPGGAGQPGAFNSSGRITLP